MCKKIKRQLTSFLLASTYILTTLGCGGAHDYMDEVRASQVITKDNNCQISHLATEKVSTQPMIISKEGHQIEFLDNHLEKVRVKEDLPYPFSRELILPVYKENSALSLKDILMHGSEWHANNLHVQLPTSSNKGYLYIGSMLRGGGISPSKGRVRCKACGAYEEFLLSDEWRINAQWGKGWDQCPYCAKRRLQETQQIEEERRRKQAEEARQREEERLNIEQGYELAYQQQKQAAETLNRKLQDQKKQQEDRLAKVEVERQIIEQQLIKEQAEEEEMLRKKVEQERLKSKEEEALRDKKLKKEQAETERLALEKEKQRLKEVQLVREKQQVDQQIERQLKEEQSKKKKEARKAEDERAMWELGQILDNHQAQEEQEVQQLQDTETANAKMQELLLKLQATTLALEQAKAQLVQQQNQGAHTTALEQRIEVLTRKKQIIEEISTVLSLEEISEDELDTFIAACLRKSEK